MHSVRNRLPLIKKGYWYDCKFVLLLLQWTILSIYPNSTWLKYVQIKRNEDDKIKQRFIQSILRIKITTVILHRNVFHRDYCRVTQLPVIKCYVFLLCILHVSLEQIEPRHCLELVLNYLFFLVLLLRDPKHSH